MGNSCGGIREPCRSETDPRYDPTSDFSLTAQIVNGAARRGLFAYEGTSYHGNGTIRESTAIRVPGVPEFPVSTRGMRKFVNLSEDGTRGVFSSVDVFAPLPSVGRGWMWAGSAYQTATFDLDGSYRASPFQFVLYGNTWNDGPVETAYSVSDKTTFATSHTKARNETYSIVTTCLDVDCDSLTLIHQVFDDNTNALRNFIVYRGRKVTEAEFLDEIQKTVVEYNVPDNLRGQSSVVSDPHNAPNETYWCEVMGDPSCAESPYANPATPLRPAVVAGFVVLAFVAIGAAAWGLCERDRKNQERRYRKVFARRVAQTIQIRSSPSSLTPELLRKEFETIGGGNGSGQIAKDDLWTFLRSGKAGTIGRSDFDALYGVMDADESGTIDFLEFCAFLADCADEYETAANRASVVATRTSQRQVEAVASSDDGSGDRDDPKDVS